MQIMETQDKLSEDLLFDYFAFWCLQFSYQIIFHPTLHDGNIADGTACQIKTLT